MTPKFILTFVTIIFVDVLGYGYISTRSSAQPTTNTQSTATDQAATQTAPTDTTAQGNTTTGSTATSFTVAQVATHSSASSCWTIIGGKVYDVTNWINNHPGGPGPILTLCGTDGTAMFGAQPGSQGRPADELKNFYIGALVQ